MMYTTKDKKVFEITPDKSKPTVLKGVTYYLSGTIHQLKYIKEDNTWRRVKPNE